MPFNLHDIALLLPEDFLLGATCVILAIDLFLKPAQRDITHWLSIAALLITLVIVATDSNPASPAFNGMYLHDGVASILKIFILAVVALVFVYARGYLRDRNLYVGEFYLLCLFATLGMMILVSAGSLVTVYLGLELLTLSSYALVGLNRDSPLSSEAAIKYFVLGALASGILLYGMSMIYGATGTLDLHNIHALASYAANDPNHTHQLLLAFGLVFLVAGIGFKFGAAPFHMWLPDVYQGSPTAVTAFIGAAPKIAAFGMAYRLLEGALGDMHPHWSEMLAVLAVLSLAIGNIVAIAQTNLKRLLAYSTISHVGFLLLGLSSGTPAGYAAAMFYAIVYALTSTAAFGVIILLARAGFEADEIDDFKGLNQRNPWYAFIVLLIMASLAGFPPLLGFFPKLLVLQAAIDGGMLWLSIIAIVFAIIGAYYYLRVIWVSYFDKPTDKAPLVLPKDHLFRWVLSLNALVLLVLGVFGGGPLLAWCYRVFGLH
jgi:NADH-quinone oxidoreductase subunit N